MIAAADIVSKLADAGVSIFTGVPCSYLTPLINEAIDSPRTRYVNAVNEGDAVGVAAGAWLGGSLGCVMFQNSGFGNAVNPLTSLAYTFRAPMLVVTTWRGQPDGEADEPQHELMGRITPGLFDLMEIPFERPQPDAQQLAGLVTRSIDQMRRTSMPFGWLLSHGVVSGEASPRTKPDLVTDASLATLPPRRQHAERFTQDAALAAIQRGVDQKHPVIATTGFTGRALYALADLPNQLYMAGSMGCASSVGVGLAAVRPERHVIVVDGDGAALMRLGAMAMAGAERPINFTHVLLDNAAHDSTGAQATTSPNVDFAAVAAACGYRSVVRIESLADLERLLASPLPGPTLLHVRTLPRQNRKLPRPTISPPEVALRLKSWLGGPTHAH